MNHILKASMLKQLLLSTCFLLSQPAISPVLWLWGFIQTFPPPPSPPGHSLWHAECHVHLVWSNYRTRQSLRWALWKGISCWPAALNSWYVSGRLWTFRNYSNIATVQAVAILIATLKYHCFVTKSSSFHIISSRFFNAYAALLTSQNKALNFKVHTWTTLHYSKKFDVNNV